MSYDDYLVKRKEAFDNFAPHMPDDINFILGCEVYITDYLFNNNDLSQITYGNSRYILTEFAYQSRFTDKTMQSFYLLVQNYGLTPVMPHVERYPYLIDNPGAIGVLKDLGTVIQTNVSSYTQEASFFRKRKLFKLIDKGLIDIVGTDAHSLHHNNPEVYTEALKAISKKCGDRAVYRMMDNAAGIFRAAQKQPTNPANNQKA